MGAEHGSERLAKGIQTASRAMRMLLSRNSLTHEELVRLSKWCNPWGQNWLSTSQISYLRTATTKKAGPQTLDALGEINLRLAEAAGDQSPTVLQLPDFGRIPIKLPAEPFFLRDPRTREPMDAGGFFLMLVGRLTPEGLNDGHISDKEARRLSDNVSRIVQAWARDRRLLLSDAMRQALEAYDVEESAREQKLRMVITGLEVWNGEQLSEELEDLGKMLGVLDGDGPIPASEVRERLYRTPKD